MISATKEGLILKLKAQPGAKRNKIVGIWHDSLKVCVSAPAEAGKANKACIELLAKKLNVPKGNIEIIKGHASRVKQVFICGLSKEEFLERLNKHLSRGHLTS